MALGENQIVEAFKHLQPEEVISGFSKEAEWARLQTRLKNKHSLSPKQWVAAMTIAATLMTIPLLVIRLQRPVSKPNALQPSALERILPEAPPTLRYPNAPNATNPAKPQPAVSKQAQSAQQKVIQKLKKTDTQAPLPIVVAQSTEPICNSTKCAIEICIYQTVRCANANPAIVAYCKTFEPEQSGQLNFKQPGRGNVPCVVTTDEIRIRKLSTGESVVIDANSKPINAEEFLKCLASNNKCNLLTGLFKAGCGADSTREQLKINNQFGDVIIQ